MPYRCQLCRNPSLQKSINPGITEIVLYWQSLGFLLLLIYLFLPYTDFIPLLLSVVMPDLPQCMFRIRLYSYSYCTSWQGKGGYEVISNKALCSSRESKLMAYQQELLSASCDWKWDQGCILSRYYFCFEVWSRIMNVKMVVAKSVQVFSLPKTYFKTPAVKWCYADII